MMGFGAMGVGAAWIVMAVSMVVIWGGAWWVLGFVFRPGKRELPPREDPAAKPSEPMGAIGAQPDPELWQQPTFNQSGAGTVADNARPGSR